MSNNDRPIGRIIVISVFTFILASIAFSMVIEFFNQITLTKRYFMVP